MKAFMLQSQKDAQRKTGCIRMGVAASIVHIVTGCGFNVIETQYNGPPSPKNTCTGQDPCGCAHAELRAAMSAQKLSGKYILLCTYSPCLKCAAAIILSQKFEGVVSLDNSSPPVCGEYMLIEAGIWTRKI